MTVRVDLYSAAGAKLDVPPLVGADILGCQYSMKIGNIGTFTLTLAADATSAQNATAGRVVWIYDDLWPVFKGVIRTREIGADKDGRLILTLVGPSIADQLIGLTTGRGLTFENQSLSAVVTSLCADTDFEAGEVDTATITARRFDGRTKWDALAATAQAVDSSLREDLLGATPQIDIGVFGESSGITLRNFPESSQSLSDNAYMKQVASLKVKAQSLDLCNRVIPWGQIEGLSGSQFNLRQVSPDSPTNTRLYLPSVGAGTANIAPISAAFHSDWAATPGNYRLSAGLNPVSSAMETQNRANAGYSMLGQYVFGPIAAQTISGNISGQMRVQEASAAYNHQFRINVRVFDGDAVLRGTLLAPTTVGTEFSDSALTNHSIPSTALASLAVEDGDYIVIEIGRGSALGQADFRIGDAATNDLPVDQTSTTDGRPWIEFDSWVPIYTDLPSGLSYPVLSDTGPDGNPYYYIEDTASQAIYGVRERWVQFKDILPLGLTANDFVAAAQTLYGMAVTYLTRHLSEQLAYEVDALGLKHVNQANGAAYFEVGDTFRLQFDGWTQDEDGTKTNYLTVDTDLYLLDFTRTFNADGSDTWKLTLATFLRALPTDGEAFRQLAQAVGIEQVAPLPYIVLGDGVVRVDDDGMNLKAEDAGNALTAPPEATRVKWTRDEFGGALIGDVLAGYATPTTLLVHSTWLRTMSTDPDNSSISDASLGVWDETSSDWLARIAAFDGPYKMVVVGPSDVTLLRLEEIDASNHRLLVQRASAVVEVGAWQGTGSTLTIATGAVTVTSGYHLIDTEGAAASDNLDTINGGVTGMRIVLQAANSGRTVVFTEAGNMDLAGGSFSADNVEDTIELIYNGTSWCEIGRSDNGA